MSWRIFTFARAWRGRWLGTLEEFLELPEFGFEHAQVRLRIYRQCIANGDWAAGRPYAEEAAESYAPWALAAAAECNEALRDWERADELYSAQSTRYPGEDFAWYFFVQRTGEGRAEEAEAMAEKCAEELSESREPPTTVLATYYRLADKPQQALALYQAIAGRKYDAAVEMHIALTADDLGETKQRDGALNRILAAAKEAGSAAGNPRSELVALATAMQSDLAKAGGADLDGAAILARLAAAPTAEESCDFYYFLGKYCAQRQRLDRAIDAWKRCMACPTLQRETRTLAGAALVDVGVPPDALSQSVYSAGKGVARQAERYPVIGADRLADLPGGALPLPSTSREASRLLAFSFLSEPDVPNHPRVCRRRIARRAAGSPAATHCQIAIHAGQGHLGKSSTTPLDAEVSRGHADLGHPADLRRCNGAQFPISRRSTSRPKAWGLSPIWSARERFGSAWGKEPTI